MASDFAPTKSIHVLSGDTDPFAPASHKLVLKTSYIYFTSICSHHNNVKDRAEVSQTSQFTPLIIVHISILGITYDIAVEVY